jgi:antitoxin YefM
MDTVSYSSARQGLARLLDKVCDDRVPVIVTRPGKRPVVLMDLGEYRSLKETIPLTGRPANALRLTRSVRAAGRREVAVYALIEPKTKVRFRRVQRARASSVPRPLFTFKVE